MFLNSDCCLIKGPSIDFHTIKLTIIKSTGSIYIYIYISKWLFSFKILVHTFVFVLSSFALLLLLLLFWGGSKWSFLQLSIITIIISRSSSSSSSSIINLQNNDLNAYLYNSTSINNNLKTYLSQTIIKTFTSSSTVCCILLSKLMSHHTGKVL